jgi:hypothetical protein
MLPSFAVSTTNFAPGTSPFKTKGLTLRAATEYYDQVIPGGTAAVKRAVLAAGDEGLATFMDTPFMASGWYDALPARTMSLHAARLLGVPHPQFMRDNGAWMADRDLRGVYRIILGLASVEMVALRLPRLSQMYLNFGSAEAIRVRERQVEAHVYGMPSCLTSWFVYATHGFANVALRMAGAREVRVRHGRPTPEGFAAGMPVVQLHFRIGWD